MRKGSMDARGRVLQMGKYTIRSIAGSPKASLLVETVSELVIRKTEILTRLLHLQLCHIGVKRGNKKKIS